MNMQSLFIGGIGLAIGLPMLTSSRKKREVAEATYLARKAELSAGSAERYFEEQRVLDAYPPLKTDRGWRIKGAVLTLMGVILIASSFLR